MEEILQYLELSGYYSRLSSELEKKLVENGWHDNVVSYASKELGVANQASATSTELEAIRRRALQLVPEQVKVEMLQHILQVLDTHVEKA